MLAAISYMHLHNIAHRDVKPDNFLLTDSSASATLKLTDFNLATFFKPSRYMTENCGSLYWMAPEVLEERYTCLCDLWSMGMVLYALVVGRAFWQKGLSFQECERRVREEKVHLSEHRFSSHDKELKDFMQQLLVRETDGRISAKTARHNTWILQCGAPEADFDKQGKNACCTVC
eukprot:TRINITY_DN21365_c0_g1_i2.p1 TRINITY_DN21365_c0_g1~~TRINITY_DN21365_c0_g1_i2.p1  ORF type:complete len:175 (-),score=36.54 TRINITY_DN21365_c0_g1_i2:86-610(-)